MDRRYSKITSPTLRTVIRDIVETVLLTLIIYWGVRLGVQNFRVEGLSMEPTLHSNQYLIVSKLSYRFSAPERGDIVVFRFPHEPSRDFIKRIVGLPGEFVEVSGGRVLIDGQALHEPYVRDPPLYNYPRHQIPTREYFVLGDNRNNSSDSAAWGSLPEQYVIGKAWFSYWPPRWFGPLTGVTRTEHPPSA